MSIYNRLISICGARDEQRLISIKDLRHDSMRGVHAYCVSQQYAADSVFSAR